MFKKLNEQLEKFIEKINDKFGGSGLDYKNPDSIYRSVQYYEKEDKNRIEVNIWVYEQKQKFNFYLYSYKLRKLWKDRFREVFKEFDPSVYIFESNGNTHQLKIEFNVPLDTDLKQLDDKIYSMLEEALDCDVNIEAKQENNYKSGKRIEYEDDIVIVYDEAGNIIYKGMEDYEPMKRENWRWNNDKKYYQLNGYVKVCLEV